MSADALVFVDTNVFVYARDASEGDKQRRASEWISALWETRRGRISTQVLQEFYVTVTRRLDPGLEPADARSEIEDLAAWKPLANDQALMAAAWEIEDRHGLSWWDSLIVAAARQLDCRFLLTEDLGAGQDLDGVTVVDPFARAPVDLGFGGG
ncbi:MAG: PIN domain-containing protein [Acidimicrobiales bacterium]